MGSATRTSTSHAKSIRWDLYGGEANREAKNRNDQRASADSSERHEHERTEGGYLLPG